MNLSETLEVFHCAEQARERKGWLSDAQSWEDANKTAELRGYGISSNGADGTGKPRRQLKKRRFPDDDQTAGGSEKENDTPGDDSDSSARTELVVKKLRGTQQTNKPKMKKPTGTLRFELNFIYAIRARIALYRRCVTMYPGAD